MNRKSFSHCPHCRKELALRKIDGRDRLVCRGCSWIQYENPLPSAAAIIYDDSGRILLVRRGIEPARGMWALPSGFIEIDETPEAACLRELKEETGLSGRIDGLVGVVSQRSEMYKNVLIIGYRVLVHGIPSPGSDALEVCFFSSGELPQIAFSSHTELIRLDSFDK